jgi:hypothetical protein
VGGVSRGNGALRNDLGERNPVAAESGGAYTDLLGAVAIVFDISPLHYLSKTILNKTFGFA